VAGLKTERVLNKSKKICCRLYFLMGGRLFVTSLILICRLPAEDQLIVTAMFVEDKFSPHLFLDASMLIFIELLPKPV